MLNLTTRLAVKIKHQMEVHAADAVSHTSQKNRSLLSIDDILSIVLKMAKSFSKGLF